jgi:hypothetical protein
LVPGTNILAIQLLGYSEGDSTACMVAQLMANFSRAPYVQNTTSNSTQIIWKTLMRTDGYLEFGTNQDETALLSVDLQSTNHVGSLTNLQPGTVYYYRVGADYSGTKAFSEWRSFKTFKPSGDVKFEVIGDSGWATPQQLAIAPLMEAWDEDLVFHVGDVVYFGYSNFAADFRYFGIYQEQIEQTPMFFAWGNHDNYGDLKSLMESMYLPTNNVTGTEHWYSFDHGDVHFVALWLDHQAGVDYSPGSAEYNWLEQDLAASQKPWKFLFFHHTWRSSSIHGQLDDYNSNGVLDSVEMELSVARLAQQYGVQIIFNGHDHNYERFTPRGGTTSFVSGGGGARLYHLYAAHPDTVFYKSTFNFLKVEVQGEETFVQAVDETGAVIDSVHIRKRFPEEQTFKAAWNTPTIETTPANDQDGNIKLQRFEFQGGPVVGRSGDFSSAGRLFINNDQSNLYFGIDETAIRGDQNLFLFVEAPSLSSSNSVLLMNTLGSGTNDPAGGVYGLHLLGNVGFTNFVPNIGIILGDEYADQPDRAFVRPGMAFPIGQGAFYLEEDFPTVPGQKLQQFNLSPETYWVPWEQSANFIEVALPYSALGNLRPGERIKVAVVSGLAGVDLEAQTREIEVGGIARNVSTNGNNVWIEGLQVQLASYPSTNLNLYISKPTDSNEVEVQWPTTPGKHYQLQYNENLAEAWNNITNTFPRTATNISDYATIPVNAGKHRFYRIIEFSE